MGLERDIVAISIMIGVAAINLEFFIVVGDNYKAQRITGMTWL